MKKFVNQVDQLLAESLQGLAAAHADLLALLAENPNPSEAEIRHGLEGNICRCTGYHNIVLSVRKAAELLEAGAQPEPVAR